MLALRLFNKEFSIIALIGVILLIGIVKKNAIMMIDVALERQREAHVPPREAIFQASLLRFRPIMMTTMAAMFGALPLAFGTGDGAEIRQPLGLLDRRRADREPGADALHDPGHLRVSRSLRPLVQRRCGRACCGARPPPPGLTPATDVRG